MRSAVAEKLDELVREGLRCEAWSNYSAWYPRCGSFLRRTFNSATATEFELMANAADPNYWHPSLGRQVGMLEGLATELDDAQLEPDPEVASEMVVHPVNLRRVFIVHGHDTEAKETVARFLLRLGLEPIILHEQANEGRTVIEKIEIFSDVSFAVVLLTPDDLGAEKADQVKLKARARQNVVLELGYFLGKLKRSRVCALYKPGVEIPSDYQGVLYTELDVKGAWRASLAQELSNARLPIKLEGLLGS